MLARSPMHVDQVGRLKRVVDPNLVRALREERLLGTATHKWTQEKTGRPEYNLFGCHHGASDWNSLLGGLPPKLCSETVRD
jgi:hypothetical protein